MKNAAGSRASSTLITATHLAAHQKTRSRARRSDDSEASRPAKNITSYSGCCRRYIMVVLSAACLLVKARIVAATDSCMPGSTLCENNTIKICDLNSGIVELKCPENTFCKADIHGARCQPVKRGSDSTSDRGNNDGDGVSSRGRSELKRPTRDDDAENEGRSHSGSRRRSDSESSFDEGDKYLFKSTRRGLESDTVRNDCSDSNGDESCVSEDSYRKGKNTSNRESRLMASASVGRREEKERARKSSGRTSSKSRGGSWKEQREKRLRNKREMSPGSLLSEAEAQEIPVFESEAHLGPRQHDAYERTRGTNQMSPFHETNGMYEMSSKSSAALSEVLAQREMMASEMKGSEAEGERSGESGHSHSPGLAHAILSKKEGSSTKNQKVIVLTVTKSMKSPPLEMHMEYTMPGSVTPVVKKFSSKDGETFTEAPPSQQPPISSNLSPNPSGSDPKHGLLTSAPESQKSAQGLSSSGPSSPGSPSGTPSTPASPKDSSASPSSPSASAQSGGSGSSSPQASAPSPSSSPSPSPSGSTPTASKSSGQQSSSAGAGTSSSSAASASAASASQESKAKLADTTPSAGASSSSKTPQSSQSSSSSSSGSSGGSGKTISKEDLMAIMKEFSFNPNPEYVDIVLKGVEEKEKDEDLVPMFLAQLAHESGGFEHIEEIACKQSGGCPGQYGTGAPGKSYHGRGFIQLSWPDNYKKAGQALGMGDELYANPEKVAADPKLAFDVSWWYWDSVVRPALGGKKDFGATTKAINGALECGGGGNEKAQKRYKIYEAICKKMSKTPAPNTGC